MNEAVNKILEDSRRSVEQLKNENEARDKRMDDAINMGDDRSMANFSAWKDYLHKYYVVILAFLSFIVALTGTDTIRSSFFLLWGSCILGASIIIGFIGIHWYLFVERKWIEISTRMAAMPHVYGERMLPDEADDLKPEELRYTNPRVHWRNKNNIEIQNLKKKIAECPNKEDKALYRLHLKGTRIENRLVKYVGATAGGWIEKVWFTFVLTSTTLSFIGLGMVFYAIIWCSA